VRAEYSEVRDRRARGSRRAPPVSLAEARSNAFTVDWNAYEPTAPARSGLSIDEDVALAELVDYIDWGPFFNAWELTGRFPDILDHPEKGETARSLYADARAMLERIVAEGWLRARATVGLFPAAADGDDVVIYRDEAREEVLQRFHFLRQQKPKAEGQANLCLADFVAPGGSGIPDHMGFFAVTAGLGIEEKLAEFEAAHDDYSEILLKALADRLAEALAEYTHRRVRRELWGYAADEELENTDLIREQYQGIRPAPGYPACPDHSEKRKLFDLLEAERNSHMELTSGYAMLPTASVSGYYFAHPQAQYFVLGNVQQDQLEDYARRKGISEEEARRNLVANLG
jgi:5-methyltetrahydrofolate--homocysteine methyltransferase